MLWGRRDRVDELVNKAAMAGKDRADATPTHELVYQNLRDGILFGEMEPAQPVTIHGLTVSLQAGMTPVREAIRRLIAEGALVFLGNRRVIVPSLTPETLEELVFLRKTIECELTHRAVHHLGPAEIAALQAHDRRLDAAIASGDIRGYLVHNYRFHQGIYASAGAPTLRETANRLWLRFGPSLRVVGGRFGTQNLPDRHKELLAAFRKGDATEAVHAMAEDIAQGMEQIAAFLATRS